MIVPTFVNGNGCGLGPVSRPSSGSLRHKGDGSGLCRQIPRLSGHSSWMLLKERHLRIVDNIVICGIAGITLSTQVLGLTPQDY